MKIQIRKEKFGIKFTNNILIKMKNVARDALEYIKCGSHNAICGEFRCLEEVRITEKRE